MAKLGLALGSGAARGYAHIAIIQELLKKGYNFELVSGTSAGSVVGAYFALHGEVDSLLEKFQELTKKDFIRLIDINNPKYSIIKGASLKEYMRKNFFGNSTFKSLTIPLVVCATDLGNHKPVYFTSGKILDAVMASLSIPGIFPPYQIGRRYFVDGGVQDPVPINAHFERGIKKVIAVNINNFTYHGNQDYTGIIHVLSNTYYMLLEKLSPKVSTKDTFILNPVFDPSFHDGLRLYKWEDYYTAGEKEVKRCLPKIKRWYSKK